MMMVLMMMLLMMKFSTIYYQLLYHILYKCILTYNLIYLDGKIVGKYTMALNCNVSTHWFTAIPLFVHGTDMFTSLDGGFLW